MVKGENFKKDFEPAIEVKAATYSGLKIEKKGKIYTAQCILDV
jgi:SHS2 domain-containing protein